MEYKDYLEELETTPADWCWMLSIGWKTYEGSTWYLHPPAEQEPNQYPFSATRWGGNIDKHFIHLKIGDATISDQATRGEVRTVMRLMTPNHKEPDYLDHSMDCCKHVHCPASGTMKTSTILISD